MPDKANRLLPVLVFSQFAGTSLWFAGNAIIDQLTKTTSGAALTSFVQFGFIAGTLLFSVFTIADRFPAKTVFFFSSLLAALANLCILWNQHDDFTLKLLRFLTGFFLAGIYPVGMKIAADMFPEKLGKALGLLVGALVMGTAFPHFVRSQLQGLQWQMVIIITSMLAAIGAFLLFVSIPSIKKAARMQKPDFSAAFTVFQSKPFRAAAFGYFGHMWELYAFWAILPTLFAYHSNLRQTQSSVFLWSFFVIATGSLGCVIGGIVSQRWGSKVVAYRALLVSGMCCLFSPLFFHLPTLFFYAGMLLWGLSVTADSPQFSALVAKAAPTANRGTALTIVTCIGFAITILSILLLKEAFDHLKEFALLLLVPGPIFGLLALRNFRRPA